MIVFFSLHGDESTNKIIDWLIINKMKFLRVNLEDESPHNLFIKFTNNRLNVCLRLQNNFVLDMTKVNYCVFRGGLFKEQNFHSVSSVLPNEITKMHLNFEISELINFFYNEIDEKSLGSPLKYKINKLVALKKAVQYGLRVPKFIVTDNKKEVSNFFNSEEQLITKALYETITFNHKNKYYSAEVEKINIREMEDFFFPSFVQEYICKFREVRTFFLNEKSFSVVFKSESTDFRKDYKRLEFDFYEIDKEIEKSCVKLMRFLGLNTGSVDFVINEDNILHFLEINPIGQFDWVSQKGGHNLYYEIFLFLKNKLNE